MALKAGRVGVAPDQVDEFGQIIGEITPTNVYTKAQADVKFVAKDWYWENNPNAGVKNIIGSPTSVGSIFTRNANGSYTANGLATSKMVLRYDFPTENGKKYKVSGCPDGGSSNTYKMDIWNIGSYFDSTPIEITGDGNTQTIEFAIVANYSANNIVFYPMVVDAQDTSSGFQPPAKTNADLTEFTVKLSNDLLLASNFEDFKTRMNS